MVDLLVLTSLDQLLFILKCYLPYFTEQAIFTRRSIVLSLLHQLVLSAFTYHLFVVVKKNLL